MSPMDDITAKEIIYCGLVVALLCAPLLQILFS